MTIHELDLDAPVEHLRVLAAGPSGAGKTHFCATFIDPVIIGARVEGGGKTVARMDRAWWYDSDVKPRVVEVSDHYDAIKIIDEVDNGLRPCKTLCLELTFYAKSVLAAFSGQVKDPRQAYGALMIHLEYLVTRLHDMQRHIVLTAISDEEGRPAVAIPGQSGTNLPAMSDIWLQLESRPGPEGAPIFKAHTRPYGKYAARHRFGDLLPAEIVPRYLDLAFHLGIEEK